MNRRIWLLALVGGLSSLFCNSLSAKTLYVATNGTGTDGLTWPTAFTTIQSAVNAAVAGSVTDPNAVTIIVGSSGTDHGSGHYKENISISLAHLTLQSENGYEQTVIESNSVSNHAVTVSGTSITVRGFSVYGSTSSRAAIALVGASSCTIEDNRCGWLDAGTYYRSYRGIFLSGGSGHTVQNNLCSQNTNAGIFLFGTSGNLIQANTCSYNGSGGGIAVQSNSQQNRVIANTCTYNTGGGLDLDDSSLNTLAQNICTYTATYIGISVSNGQNNVITENLVSNNLHGIEISSQAHYNSITCNLTQNNTYDGIQLKGNNNEVVANTCRLNSQGMYTYQCQYNTIYRNKFSDNSTKQVNAYYTVTAGDLWNSAIPFCYAYDNSIYSSKMGSYFSDYAGSDADNNGIGEDPYTATPLPGSLQKQDLFPLIDPDMIYAVQAWYLAEDQTMTMDPNQPGFLQTLSGNSSLVWMSDTAALEEIAFNALDSTDGWNGRIRFAASFAGNTIQIQMGYVDPNEGTFVSGGPAKTLSGTDSIFTYETSGQSFSVKDGVYLAVKIINTSATARQIYVGGAWTYISAPAGTQMPWPGAQQQPPQPPANPADLDNSGLVDMLDMAYLSARWGQTDCDSLNYFCDFVDINGSGGVEIYDLLIMAQLWLTGPQGMPGDLNGDWKVDLDDVAVLSGTWPNEGSMADLIELCEQWLTAVWIMDLPCSQCTLACEENLSHFADSIGLYAIDNDENFPDSLVQLFASFPVEIQYWTCLCSQDSPGDISYAYRGTGRKQNLVDADMILMYDRSGNHQCCQNIYNVLFGDYHIGSLTEEELATRIDADNQWRTDNGLQPIPLE